MRSIKTILLITRGILYLCLLHNPSFAIVTDSELYDEDPNLEMPVYLDYYIDPQFGTKITRIAGDVGEQIPSDAEGMTWGDLVRHRYINDPAWNADMSLLLINNKKEGTPGSDYLILDGSSYEYKFALDFSPDELLWSPTDPNFLIYTKKNSLFSLEITRDDSNNIVLVPHLLKTFSKYPNETRVLAFNGKGNLSLDGRKLAFSSKRTDGKVDVYPYTINSYTPDNPDTSTAYESNVITFDVKPLGVAISPLGKFVIVRWSDEKTTIYNASNMQEGGSDLIYNLSHFDYAVDIDGSEVAVGVHKPAETIATNVILKSGIVIKQKLDVNIEMCNDKSEFEDCGMTVLLDKGYASHVSTRNVNRLGWAYVSYLTEMSDYPNGNHAPFYSEVVAVNMDGSQRFERYGHFRRKKTVLPAGVSKSEPHALPSPDGKKIIFASNWNNSSSNGIAMNPYVIETIEESLLLNSDFEAGFESWSKNQPVSITLDGDGYAGSKSLRFGGEYGSAGVYQYINTSGGVAGDVYSFSLKYKSTGSGGNVYISFYDGSNKQTVKVGLAPVSSYTSINTTVTAPSSYDRIRVYIYKGTSGTTTIHADDLMLVKESD